MNSSQRKRVELRPGLTIASYNLFDSETHPQEILHVHLRGLREAGLPKE
jgi:hypothetical protein